MTHDHDPQCLSQEFLPADLPRFCDCERVLRIRADERERVANAMHGLSTDGAGWVLLRDVWATITRLGGESDA